MGRISGALARHDLASFHCWLNRVVRALSTPFSWGELSFRPCKVGLRSIEIRVAASVFGDAKVPLIPMGALVIATVAPEARAVSFSWRSSPFSSSCSHRILIDRFARDA